MRDCLEFFILWWWSNFLLWSLWLSSFGMNCHSLNPRKIQLYNFLLKFQMCSPDRLEMFATGRQSLSENLKIHSFRRKEASLSSNCASKRVDWIGDLLILPVHVTRLQTNNLNVWQQIHQSSVQCDCFTFDIKILFQSFPHLETANSTSYRHCH